MAEEKPKGSSETQKTDEEEFTFDPEEIGRRFMTPKTGPMIPPEQIKKKLEENREKIAEMERLAEESEQEQPKGDQAKD